VSAAERLRQAAEDIRALGAEHAPPEAFPHEYTLAELILRLVADALDPEEEREAA
jgi:hypothetical protein